MVRMLCLQRGNIEQDSINSDNQGNDLPVNTAKFGSEALPAACMIAL